MAGDKLPDWLRYQIADVDALLVDNHIWGSKGVKMGYEIGGNTARLEFQPGTVLDGATVRVSLDMSVRDFLGLQRTIAGFASSGESVAGETLEQWEAAYRQFAGSALKSWDLQRDGVDIPADVDGFMSLPFAAANAIFTAWAGALGGTPPNSPAASQNGALSEADFVAMAAV